MNSKLLLDATLASRTPTRRGKKFPKGELPMSKATARTHPARGDAL